jgi:hypothetical protein
LLVAEQPTHRTSTRCSDDDPDLVVDNLVAIFGTIFAKAWGRGWTTSCGWPAWSPPVRVRNLTTVGVPNAGIK